MGAWKPLLPWPGPAGTLIGAAVSSALAAGVGPVVVAGYRAGELRAALAGLDGLDGLDGLAGGGCVDIVENPGWESGMLGSVVTGLERARLLGAEPGGPEGAGGLEGSGGPEGTSAPGGCLVAHADMPLVPVCAYEAVLERAALREASGLGPAAIFPSYPRGGGLLGHPVWIPFAFLDGLAALGPGERLRDYLLAGPWEAVDVDDEGILVDLDTEEAYAERYAFAARAEKAARSERLHADGKESRS